MRLKTILEQASNITKRGVTYSVKIPNQSGTFKRFKSADAPGAYEWRNSYDSHRQVHPKHMPQEPKVTQFKIWQEATDAIGSSFPDGDPMDHLASFMRKHDLTMDDIDDAMKLHEKLGFYEYLAQMWDDHQSDQIHDAKNGHIEDNSQFYEVDAKGKVIATDNPWR